MTDIELLEFAAKAAGIELECPVFAGRLFFGFWLLDRESDCCWNPLTNDGDALRLAVKLEMQISIGLRRIDAVIVSDSEEASIVAVENKTGDTYAATRRAIVRAAAAIGKAMP